MTSANPTPFRVCAARWKDALLRVRSTTLRLRRHLLFAALALMAAWLLLPRVPLLDGLDFSRVITDRDGRVLRIVLTRDDKVRVFTPLAEISPRLITATLSHEDGYFETHPGINPFSTLRAACYFVTGHARGGASTITMQVARLRYQLYTRSLWGKARQMYYALALERHYTKAQILEAYLNLTPYGGNIEGLGAASLVYLGKPPAQLTWPEAVSLSLVPQSPAWRQPLPHRENLRLTAAHRHLYDELLARGIVKDSLGRDYILRGSTRPPFEAPHAVNAFLEEQNSATGSAVNGSSGTLAVDLPLQKFIERRITSYVATARPIGIRNAAVMLVDTRTMDVLAQVGSADFFDASINGQVDGTRSPRSPGSALKPLIYALALDQGLIHPQSLLVDAPRRFADYNPENSDREFCGPISARDALARSRNVPAVDLTSRLAHPTFYEFLQRAGLPLKDEKTYGLSLALGGEEVTMEQVVTLYAMLANGGQLRPLRHTLNDPAAGGINLPPTSDFRPPISPEASFLALEMLANIPAPGQLDSSALRSIFWKTGTSHGCRDAWSVAVVDHYVLAVWIGNFDSSSNPAFAGRTAAAPLLFQIIDGLRERGLVKLAPHLPPPGANLRHVDLCAISGQLPGPHCPRCTSGWFIPGVSPIGTCTVHREVFVDLQTGLRVPSADGPRPVRREIFEFWPSNLLALFEKAGLPRPIPPPFLPGSALEFLGRSGRPPQIVSPAAHQSYALRPGTSDHSLPLTAETDADVTKLYWFAGRRFLGATSPRQPLIWQSEPGEYQITALDDHGRSASRRLTVLLTAQ